MDAYLLHCLNHVAKTADRIKRNNTRLEAASKQSAEGGGVEDLPRDQVSSFVVQVLLVTAHMLHQARQHASGGGQQAVS